MGVNPYFRRTIKNEQELLESLTTEAIKIYGHDMVYLPREKVTEDTILGEQVSEFTDANRIEMYMENSEGFEGDSEMSRFGLDVKDSATFVVSRKRFLEVMGHNPEIRKIGRPREGDIIYFDYPYGMFEIKYVKHDNPFYQAGDRYCFKLSCEAFKSSNEKIDTGESELDAAMDVHSSYLKTVVVAAGSGNYIEGEEVYVGTVGNKRAYGRVVSWTSATNTLLVNMQEGDFIVGETLVGASGATSRTVSSVGESTTRAAHQDEQDNEQIQLEQTQDDIFDFTDTDPFSEGLY
jgi:signal peptidase I